MMALDVTPGVGNTADSEPAGTLGIRLIPAGTLEPEKTRLQKVLDLLQKTELERDYLFQQWQISEAMNTRLQLINNGLVEEINAWKERFQQTTTGNEVKL